MESKAPQSLSSTGDNLSSSRNEQEAYSSSDESDSPHYEVISTGDDADTTSKVKILNKDGHKALWDMTAAEKLEYALQQRESGSLAYNSKKFSEALEMYQRAIDVLEADAGFVDDADLSQRRSDLQTVLRGNSAQCMLKLEKYAEAERLCNTVLLIEPKNEKALFRRGLARFERNAEGDLIAARQDFEACMCIDPQNRAAEYYRTICEKRSREQLKQDKRLYGSIFNKLSVELNLEAAENKKVEEEQFRAADPFSNISVWDNKMADAFISLEQEMEAFGECAPRVKSVAEIRREGADDMSDDSEADEQQDELAATRVKGSN